MELEQMSNTQYILTYIHSLLAAADKRENSIEIVYIVQYTYLENVADVIGGRLYGEVDRKAPDA